MSYTVVPVLKYDPKDIHPFFSFLLEYQFEQIKLTYKTKKKSIKKNYTKTLSYSLFLCRNKKLQFLDITELLLDITHLLKLAPLEDILHPNKM